MLTSVPTGTTTRSAPIREKLVAMPSRSAQPVTKAAKPTPTAIVIERPRNSVRTRRLPTF